jgi:hypothetical protein
MNKYPILILPLLFICASCETIHTGVLGDIPTGMKPSSAIPKGEIYRDPQGRFEIIAPDSRNLVPRRTAEGVVLEGKDLDRGDMGYAVLVYPVPAYVAGTDESVLQLTFDSLKVMLEQRGADVQVAKKSNIIYKGHAGMDVYYFVRPKRSSYILYVARLVKVNNSVYNMYYFYGAAYWTETKELSVDFIEKQHLPFAERLYKNTNF